MKIVIIILSMVLISSCSSVSERRNVSDGIDFSDIKNQDFKQSKYRRYKQHLDRYKGGIELIDALSEETLAKIDKNNLDSALSSSDPLTVSAALCYQKRFDEAYNTLDSIYREYRLNPSYWNQLGTCNLISGNKKLAWLYYNKSYDLNRRYAPAVNNLAVIYFQEGKVQKAFAGFKKASNLNPMSLTPMFNIATIYLKYGFINKAEKIFRSLNNSKSDNDVLSGIAHCLFFRGNSKEAERYFSKIDKKLWKRSDIGLSFSVVLKMNGKNSRALDVFEDVILDRSNFMKSYHKQVANYLGVKK